NYLFDPGDCNTGITECLRLFMKRTFEEKLKIISLYKSGMLQRGLCKQFHMGRHYLEDLVDSYEIRGENGLRKEGHNKLSGHDKEILVREFLEKGVTLRYIKNKIHLTCF
ncbi:MAG: helix-turn-helix domain containing protein, partial [Bacteroidales bacterium]|nr:helix-turn-helix domain containing protein [Bacteroidales bacterium]